MPDSDTMAAVREEYRRKYGREMPEDEAPIVEQQPQGYLQRMKALAGKVHDALKIEPVHSPTAANVGSNMVYFRNLNQALSKPGGMDQEEEARIFSQRYGNAPITDESIQAQRQRDIEAARKRVQGGK